MAEDRPEGDDTNVTLPETSSQGSELELCTTHLNPVQPIQSNQSEIAVEQSDPEGTTSCKVCVRKGPFTTIDALFLLAGMILYITDVVTDILVGVQYLRNGHKLWSTMTFIFVLLPSVTVHFFSFIYFITHPDEETNHRMKGFLANLRAWSPCLIHVLQLGVIIRYWRTLKLGLQSRNNDAKDNLKKKEYNELYLLRLLEAFMESAPQLVLQVYIMVESNDFYWLTPASTIVSLISLASTIEVHYKSERDEDPAEANVYFMLMIRIVWRLFTITARVIALVLFASIYKWWVFVLVGAHWVMTIWLLYKWDDNYPKDMCMDVCLKPFLAAVFGIIYIFCFFMGENLIKVGQTRSRAAVYYTIIFIENTIMISLWYIEKESRETWYGIPALFFVWGGFFIGIFIFFCLVPHLQPDWEKVYGRSGRNGERLPMEDVK